MAVQTPPQVLTSLLLVARSASSASAVGHTACAHVSFGLAISRMCATEERRTVINGLFELVSWQPNQK